MKTVFTIDRGNTLTKISVFRDGTIVESRRLKALSVETAGELIEKWEPDEAIYCSVVHIDPKFIESLRHMIPGGVMTLTGRSQLPIGIDYRTPETLGADRIAAACGAVALYGREAMLVVDAGSAITIDVVDAGGIFRGGNIAPGVDMRLRAMHNFTGRLPLISRDGVTPSFGFDTETALRAGAVRGAAAEIAQAARQAAAQYACRRIVMTGGNAGLLREFIAAMLPENIEITAVDSLVEIGLLNILRYNETL